MRNSQDIFGRRKLSFISDFSIGMTKVKKNLNMKFRTPITIITFRREKKVLQAMEMLF